MFGFVLGGYYISFQFVCFNPFKTMVIPSTTLFIKTFVFFSLPSSPSTFLSPCILNGSWVGHDERKWLKNKLLLTVRLYLQSYLYVQNPCMDFSDGDEKREV